MAADKQHDTKSIENNFEETNSGVRDNLKLSIKEAEETTSEENPEEMLSWKVVAILLVVYFMFIILGGIIFHFIESSNEQGTVEGSSEKIRQFLENNTCVSAEELEQLIVDVIEAYDQGITLSNDTASHNTNWDVPSSIFFSTTIVTTIGYGNISPATAGGRAFTVFYALLGIPLFIITSGQLGLRFSRFTKKLTSKLLKRVTNEKWKSILSASVVIVSGFLVFSLCAAIIFTFVEEWSYGESVYYTFITLTTVGFGDYYPGFASGASGDEAGAVMYRLFVSLWIISGLIWMASTLSALSDATGRIFSYGSVSHDDANSKTSKTDNLTPEEGNQLELSESPPNRS